MGNSSKRDERGLEAAEQEATIIALRLEGKTFEEIGAALGVNRGTAHRTFNRALARKRPSEEVVHAARTQEIEHLDKTLARAEALYIHEASLLKGKGKAASDPRHTTAAAKALDTTLRVFKRRSELLGFDAPTRQEITGKDGEPLSPSVTHDELLSALARLATGAGAPTDRREPDDTGG